MAHMQFQPLSIAENMDRPEFVHLGNQYLNARDFTSLGNESLRGRGHEMLGHGGLETQDRIALLEEEAYEKGFAQGEKDGFEIGEQKAAKTAEHLEVLVKELQHLNKDIVRAAEKDLLDIVFAIAEKVIHTQIAHGSSAIGDTILQAIRMAADKSKITLRVHPKDYDLVEKLRPRIFSEIKELKTISVNSDASVTRGGCLLETARGNVDASIETQLKNIAKTIEETYWEEDAV